MDMTTWWTETQTTIASIIAASAAGRLLFVGYQFRDHERHIVIGWLMLEVLAAAVMGVLALGTVEVLQQVFDISLYGWPAFALAAIFGWLGPKGMQGFISLWINKKGRK